MRKRIIMTATGLSLGRMLTFAVVYKPHVSSLSNTEMVLAAAEENPEFILYNNMTLVPYDAKDGGTVGDDFETNSNNLLDYVANFHIFARHANLEAHTGGNMAVEKVTGTNNFGTAGDGTHLQREVYYIQNLAECANSSFITKSDTRDNKAVFGSEMTIHTANDLKEVHVNSIKMDHLSYEEVYQDKEKNQYINFNQAFSILNDKSKELAGRTPDASLKNSDLGDQNKRTIDISKYEEDGKNEIVINLAPEVLTLDRPLNINDLIDDKSGTTIIINVDTNGAEKYVMSSEINLNYLGKNGSRPNQVTEFFEDNNLLWNFYDSTAKDMLYRGEVVVDQRFSGSVLAPEATITAEKNLDGNIVASRVNIKAQSHRWDLQDTNEIEEEDIEVPGGETPDPPDKETPDPPEPEPETPDPEPEPQPEPEPEPEPGPEPETPDPEEVPEVPNTPDPELPDLEIPDPEPEVDPGLTPETDSSAESPFLEEVDESTNPNNPLMEPVVESMASQDAPLPKESAGEMITNDTNDSSSSLPKTSNRDTFRSLGMILGVLLAMFGFKRKKKKVDVD